VGRLLLRLDVQLGTAQIHTTGSRYDLSYPQFIDYRFTQYNLSLCPQLIYKFYNGQKIKFYAGTGLRGNFSNYPDNMYTITTQYPGTPYVSQSPDFFRLNHEWFSLQLQTGVVVNTRFEFTIFYVGGLQTLNQNVGLWGESLQSFRSGIIYHFNEK